MTSALGKWGTPVVVNETVRVIRMDMGQQHIVDGVRRNPDRAQIVGQLAQRRSHGGTRAGVDQRALAVECQQEGIDRKRHRAVGREPRHLRSLRRRNADKVIERRIEHAIADGGDVDSAHFASIGAGGTGHDAPQL